MVATALSMDESCCGFLPDDVGVILCPNPAFPPKVLFNFHMHQSVELRYLCLAQEWGEEDQEGSWLCPVKALKA